MPTKKKPAPKKKVVKKVTRVVKAAKVTTSTGLAPIQQALATVAPPAAALLKQVEVFTVTGPGDVTLATELLVRLKTLDGTLEAKRKEFTKPLKDEAKRIEAQFKPTADALTRADALLRQKLLSYREVTEREAAKARNELVAQAEAAAEAGDNEQALVLSQQAMSTDSGLAVTTPTDNGSVQVKHVWAFEVDDMGAVPPEYFTLDEAKVRAAVRAGTRQIPGIRIFQREQVAVSAGVLP